MVADAKRDGFLATMRDLDLAALQRYPLPKRGGFPIGHEIRVLRKHLTGHNAQFDSSAFSRLYRALTSSKHQALLRAFVLGDPLALSVWQDLLGARTAADWMATTLLEDTPSGLRARFRAFAMGGLVLLADPQEYDHRERVYVGQDSADMAEMLSRYATAPAGRHLDVGTGTGVGALSCVRTHSASLGIDINPRAITIARLNAELNGLACEMHRQDAFTADYPPFDWITWNLPFMFLPESERDNLAAYGGALGIELTLRFIERLPRMLTPLGAAYLMSASPRLFNGTDALERDLMPILSRGQLDVTMHEVETYWGSHQCWKGGHISSPLRAVPAMLPPSKGGKT